MKDAVNYNVSFLTNQDSLKNNRVKISNEEKDLKRKCHKHSLTQIELSQQLSHDIFVVTNHDEKQKDEGRNPRSSPWHYSGKKTSHIYFFQSVTNNKKSQNILSIVYSLSTFNDVILFDNVSEVFQEV